MAAERGKALQSNQTAPGPSKNQGEIVNEMFAEQAKGGESSKMAEERAAVIKSITMTAEQAEVVAAERSIDPQQLDNNYYMLNIKFIPVYTII